MDGRERILQAAIQVFSEEGFDHTSIRTIAARAEVTNPSIYYHFESKEGLFLAVLNEALKKHGEMVFEATTSTPSVRDILVGFVKATVLLVREHPGMGRLIYGARFGCPKNQSVRIFLEEKTTQTWALVRSILRQGFPDSSDQRVELLAIGIMSLVNGLTQLLLDDEESVEIGPEVIANLVDLILSTH